MKPDIPPKIEQPQLFIEKLNDIDSAIRFFSEPKNLVDEKEKALDFFSEEIVNIPKDEVVSIYQKIIDQKKFTLSKNNIKILYFAFTKLEDEAQKNKLLQIAKALEEGISSPMLHFYIEEMVLLMDGTKKEDSSDRLISKISKDRYGAIFEDGNLYLSNIDESEIVSEKLKLIKQPKSYEEDQARIKAVRDVSDLLFNNGPINSKRLHNSGVINNEQDINFQDQYDEYLGFLDNISKRVLLDKFGFNFNDLTLPEQFQFISFVKSQTIEKIQPIINFSKKFSNDGFRTFLSIEQGGKEMGDKIINLGNNLSYAKETAQKVFAKYGELIDSAEKTEEEIQNLYKNEEIPPKIFESIKEILLKKGLDLLCDIGNRGIFTISEDEILNKLEDIKTSTIIMGQSYMELFKEGIKVPIEEIRDTTLEKILAKDLSEKEKEELLKVYENGRPKETYENKEHIKLLTDEFRETLNNENTYVFNIRFEGKVIAFATFNKENANTLHIGGLTFIDDVRNPAIAVAVMNSVMNEFGDYNIKALVHSENKILPMYQKRFGFKIVGELPREENAGELYYEIERSKNIKEEKNIGKKEEFEKAA